MEKQKVRDIGIGVTPPEKACSDSKCPFHGTLGVRGRVITGTVVSTRAQHTAVIERNYLHFVPKFERHERRHSRIAAHKPDCIDAKVGDKVKIAECRPLSKTKAFVVVENLSAAKK